LYTVQCDSQHLLPLTIFGKQHQHTFRNDVPIQLSLSLHFCLFYLLSNSSDADDKIMFFVVDSWWF